LDYYNTLWDKLQKLFPRLFSLHEKQFGFFGVFRREKAEYLHGGALTTPSPASFLPAKSVRGRGS
jgi:hypothetical protein